MKDLITYISLSFWPKKLHTASWAKSSWTIVKQYVPFDAWAKWFQQKMPEAQVIVEWQSVEKHFLKHTKVPLCTM